MLRNTFSICPKCNQISEGAIVQSGNNIMLKMKCSNKHYSEDLITPNAEFYQEIYKIIKNNYHGLKVSKNNPISRIDPEGNSITTIHINITDRCNLNCPYCFAQSENKKEIKKEIDLETILEQLKPYEKQSYKPMIVLIGGEPTIRDDLTNIICELTKRNYNVRVSTNGLLLQNKTLLESYKKAGLNWILLQFDGFNSESSLHLRGIDLTEKKTIVLNNLMDSQIKTHLIMMVSKEVNQNEIYNVITYAFNKPYIYALNLYPQSLTGRYQEKATYVIDCIEYIEKSSNGTITRQDFITCKRIWQRFYRVTKKPIFRQNLCTYPIFLFRIDEKIYPINRLFSYKLWFKYPLKMLKLLLLSFKLLFWDKNPNKNFLYLNIEKFYHSNLIDLDGAYDCHNVFLTKDGFIPLCIYNSIYRPKNCV